MKTQISSPKKFKFTQNLLKCFIPYVDKANNFAIILNNTTISYYMTIWTAIKYLNALNLLEQLHNLKFHFIKYIDDLLVFSEESYNNDDLI